jgi:hypothetical protein
MMRIESIVGTKYVPKSYSGGKTRKTKRNKK